VLNDFYLRDYGYGWGVDYSGRNAAAADYTQRAVPADSARRIGVMDRRFSGLHATKTAEQVYQESLQTAEQVYIASEGAANVTRAGTVTAANAQSAADNATSWANKLELLIGSSPWLTFAIASADVEADYLTTLVTPTADYQSALAVAEKDYAKTISQSRFVGTQPSFYQKWAEDLNTTYYSFNNPNTYYGHYRTESLRAVAYAGSNNLSRLDGGSNGYSASPRTEQIAAFQTPPSYTNSSLSASATTQPPETPPTRIAASFSNGGNPSFQASGTNVSGSSMLGVANGTMVTIHSQTDFRFNSNVLEESFAGWETKNLGFLASTRTPKVKPPSKGGDLITASGGRAESPALNFGNSQPASMVTLPSYGSSGIAIAPLGVARPDTEVQIRRVSDTNPSGGNSQTPPGAASAQEAGPRHEIDNDEQGVVAEQTEAKTKYTVQEIEDLVKQGIAFHPRVKTAKSVSVNYNVVVFSDLGGDGIITLVFEKIAETRIVTGHRASFQVPTGNYYYKIIKDSKIPFAPGADATAVAKQLAGLRQWQRADMQWSLIQGERDVQWWQTADVVLTTALHLVPLGEAFDEALQGNYSKMAWALAGDAATFIGGPLAKLADNVADAAKVAVQAGKAASRISAIMPCSGKLRLISLSYDVAGGVMSAGDGIKVLQKEGLNGVPQATLMFGDSFLKLMGAGIDAKNIKRFCFPGGTLVATEAGPRAIETIEPWDKVWAFNLQTGEWELQHVEETFAREYGGELVGLTIQGEIVESTPQHPYWVISGEDLTDRPEPDEVPAEEVGSVVPGRWVPANYVREGDVVLLRSGEQVAVTAITRRWLDGMVYNLRVGSQHNYAVGGVEVLVHNTECFDLQPRVSQFDTNGMGRLHHSAPSQAVAPILKDGFRIDIPNATDAFHNSRFGSGVYLGDSVQDVLAERAGGVVLDVEARLGKTLDTVGRGVIAPDVAKGIARGAKKHGYDSIRFKSDKGPGINTVIFDPKNVRPIGVAE
jgi:hypothetical protein